MKAYLSLFKIRLRMLLQYRVAALAGLVTQVVFGYMMVSVLIAFIGGDSGASTMTTTQAVTYTWIGQALLAMLPWNIDRETGESIRTGAVAYDLSRPLDLYGHWFARVLAMRIGPTLLKSFPLFLVATFLLPEHLRMVWPGPAALLAWLLSLVGALLLSSSITAWMQSTLFWTVTGDGVTRIFPHFVTLLSGMVIPLQLMPSWLQTFLRFQPFSGLVDRPNQLFVGLMAPSQVWEVLALQLVWAAFFVVLGRVTMQRGLNHLTVAGG